MPYDLLSLALTFFASFAGVSAESSVLLVSRFLPFFPTGTAPQCIAAVYRGLFLFEPQNPMYFSSIWRWMVAADAKDLLAASDTVASLTALQTVDFDIQPIAEQFSPASEYVMKAAFSTAILFSSGETLALGDIPSNESSGHMYLSPNVS